MPGRRKSSVTSKLVASIKNNLKKKERGFLIDLDKIEDEEPPLQRYLPERLDVLCEETGMKKGQVRSLYRAFKQVCPNGAINEFTFRNIYCQLFPRGANGNAYAHYVFKAIDGKQTDCVSFSELVRELAFLVNGTLQEKLRWVFRLYDIDHDGEITIEEMSALIGSIHDLVGPCDARSEKHTSSAFKKLDLNADGVITIDEFMDFCCNDATICKSFKMLSGW